MHKLRTVIWDFAGQAVPDSLLEDISRLYAALENPDCPYSKTMRNLLAPQEIKAFQSRLRHLLKQKRFPMPGPVPNYPWPPV